MHVTDRLPVLNVPRCFLPPCVGYRARPLELPPPAPSSPMIASARVGRQGEMDVPSSDFPEQDDPDYDDLAKEQLHALRADFAETFNRLSDIQAGNRMRAM